MSDLIVRRIRRKSAVTYCFPGAQVKNILEQIPRLLDKHNTASTVIIHVGGNDVTNQTSEILKRDFSELLCSL